MDSAPWLVRARALPAPDERTWRPIVYRADDDTGLDALLASGAVRVVHDTLLDQLGELVEARDPARRYPPAESRAAATAWLAGRPAHRYGNWVWYPWSGRLVHLLPASEHREVRTDRNRYKITAEEQWRLAQATIGVIGLSVGQAAALTLALEGIGGRLRLADLDTLGLSNLNRLRAGVHELGVSKAVLAAREIAELDPYLPVEIYTEGITLENLDPFLDGLDLLVEECDDLLVKLRVRERARARRIPVLMDTSDRGLLDIERFDREPHRPLLHGLVGDLRAEDLHGLPTKAKVPYLLRILGEDTLSPRGAATLLEVRETVSTWPQLASGIALGGALVADTSRRILLGEHTSSGRFYVDLEAIIREGGGAYVVPEAPQPAPPPVPEARAFDVPTPIVPSHHPPDLETARGLAAAAVLAPSGHNAQPWRFRWADGTFEGRVDPARSLHVLDFRDGGAFVALGAASLNAELAAHAAGLAPTVALAPDPADPHLAFRIRLGRGVAVVDPLLPWLGRRVTNRRLGERGALGADAETLLADAAAEGADLLLVQDSVGLDLLGAAIGAGDRLTWLFEPSHQEIVEGLRWTPADVARTRDGLDLDALELSEADRAGVQVISRWPRAALLARLGAGRVLEQAAKDAVSSAAAIGLIVVPGGGPAAYLRGGRAMQRVWLRASALGLAIHPMSTLPYLFARHAAGATAAWPRDIVDRLTAIEVAFRAVLPGRADSAEILLFRIGRSPDATARSLRRPVEAVLEPG
ncbi:MAG: Rv1355c family protein [Pseudomonadota bacterium]|nr:Rv1355c family protein [Pseudomonadota bacterium]